MIARFTSLSTVKFDMKTESRFKTGSRFKFSSQRQVGQRWHRNGLVKTLVHVFIKLLMIQATSSRRVNHRLTACLGRQGMKTVNENYVKKIEILIGTSNVFRR